MLLVNEFEGKRKVTELWSITAQKQQKQKGMKMKLARKTTTTLPLLCYKQCFVAAACVAQKTD